MNAFNLETIFKLINFPKQKGAPPYNAKILMHFGNDDYFLTLRELGKLRIRKETKVAERKLFLQKLGDNFYLKLAEIDKGEA